MRAMRPNPELVKTLVRGLVVVLRDRRGATALEYGLMLALVVLSMFIGLTALGQTASGMWNNVSAKVEAAR